MTPLVLVGIFGVGLEGLTFKNRWRIATPNVGSMAYLDRTAMIN